MTYTCRECGSKRTRTMKYSSHADADGDDLCDVCGKMMTFPKLFEPVTGFEGCDHMIEVIWDNILAILVTSLNGQILEVFWLVEERIVFPPWPFTSCTLLLKPQFFGGAVSRYAKVFQNTKLSDNY